MAAGKDKSKERRSEVGTDTYTGPERRKNPDRRKTPRRAGPRRYAPRRLDERRSSGVGEVMDERRGRSDRRRDERRKMKRRQSDRRTLPPGRRKNDGK